MPLVDVRGVSVNFPFEPYKCQETYMEKVVECLQTGVNGVLESPTGTGKTLCLLCSSLAWLQDRKAQTELNRQMHISSLVTDNSLQPENVNSLVKSLEQSTGHTWGGSQFAVPKIIYASRTHSQLSQAVGEMKRTAYNSMKVSVIGSREQLCIHDQVRKETSNTNKVHMCRAKVSARTCYFYNHFDDIKKNSDVRSLVGSVVDIEDMVQYGEKQKVCPYYMARELKNDADIIFMPYNYLLDPKSRKAHGVELQGNIIIFDEAHNVKMHTLKKICEDSSSFDLSSADLATAIEEVSRLSEKILEMAQAEAESLVEMTESSMPEPEFNLDDLLRLKGTLKDLEDRLDAIAVPSDGKGVTKPGQFLFELFSQVNIAFETKNFFVDLLDKITVYLTNDASSRFHTKGAGLSKFADILKIVFSREVPQGASFYHHQMSLAKAYKVHIQQSQSNNKNSKKLDLWTNSAAANKQGRVLSYWCFSPGHAMSDLVAHGIKCVILTSGTLSPLDSFTAEMQIPFPVRLENPHVIEKHQIWIGMMEKGPDGTVLNSNYQTRFNASYQASLGNSIVNFARVVPNGMLVFFPSYPVMEKCLDNWQQNNIWNRIMQYKAIFVEPRGKGALYEAMEEFYEKINDPTLNGAIFVAVCRGKVSEGLDFSDINGRAVIVTGLPYPPRMDPKIILKMQFLDEMKGKQGYQSLTGNEWYKQQASRAVNQAIGRVIRHRHDYGAIILCDTRFSSLESIRQLPVWVRPYVNKYSGFGQAIKDVMVFFKTAEKTLPAPVHSKKRVPAEAGCQGAYFMPTSARSAGPPTAYQQAKFVAEHVKSLRKVSDDEVGIAKLKIQYEGSTGSTSKGRGPGLLNALDYNEQTSDDNFLDDSIGQLSMFKKQSVDGGGKKIPTKKKIIIKKRSDGAADVDKISSVETAASTKTLNSAEIYISQVKKCLSSDSYKIFSKALQEYKKLGDFNKVASTVASLFTEDTANFPLFRKFYSFVRPKDKKDFDELCRNITGQGCGYRPEDSVSRKRILTGSTNQNCKRAKTEASDNCVSASSNIASDKKTNSVMSVTCNNTKESLVMSAGSASCSWGILGIGMSSENVTSKPSTTEKHSFPLKRNIQNGDDVAMDDGKDSVLNNSSEDLFEEKSSNKPVGVMSLLTNVTGPLDIRNTKREPSGYTCCMCHQDAHIPFKASTCRHVCCFACWRKVFEASKTCPACGERVRRRNLARLVFYGPDS